MAFYNTHGMVQCTSASPRVLQDCTLWLIWWAVMSDCVRSQALMTFYFEQEPQGLCSPEGDGFTRQSLLNLRQCQLKTLVIYLPGFSCWPSKHGKQTYDFIVRGYSNCPDYEFTFLRLVIFIQKANELQYIVHNTPWDAFYYYVAFW